MSKQNSIFTSAWWLNAVSAPVGKKVQTLELRDDDGNVVATMPMQITQRGPLKAVLLPQLTQHSHIWTASHVDRLQTIARLLAHMRREMRRQRILILQFADYMTDDEAQLLRNAGFALRQGVSYVIEPDDFSLIDSRIHPNKRRGIRKAGGFLHLEVDRQPDTHFFAFLSGNFAARGRNTFYTEKLWRSLWHACLSHGAAVILWAKDGAIPAAAVMLVETDTRVYYLVPTFSADYSKVRAMEWITREAIRYATTQGKTFDFEGSSVESIAKAYRFFSPTPQYFYVGDAYLLPFTSALLRLKTLVTRLLH